MSWISAAHRGSQAEKTRQKLQSLNRQRKNYLVQTYGKLGFIIAYLENYLLILLPQTSFPCELILHILKMNINDNSPSRIRYHYIKLEGKMSTSPFRHYMIRKSPYFSKYTKLPMHDLLYHDYRIVIQEYSIALFMTSTNRYYNDFKLSLDLSKQFIREFLKGISCFEEFKERLLNLWNISEEWLTSDIPMVLYIPDILDARNDFYKMRQMWAVIYTVRGMIDFPLR